MANLEIGIEFWPWNDCRELLSYGARALKSYPFSHLWMCDEFQYEDAITTLAVMAMELDVSVGTMVTFPWRNPLELAQRFASISKLARPGRRASLGIGAGGAVQVQVIGEKKNPVDVMAESVQLLRGLLRGESVPLAQFPKLAARFRYNTKTNAKLYFPPPTPVPVYLAAGGPKMFEVAGRHADGVIFSQIVATTSLPAVKAGFLRNAVNQVEAVRAHGDAPLKKLYNLHISVSRDGYKARQWAKRNASYGLAGAYIRYPEVLKRIGIDPEEVAPVAEAYLQGKGVEEAARRISDSLLARSGMVFGGTPEDCVSSCRELKGHLAEMGFDHLVIGVPLGPNIPEAIDLLTTEIIPNILN
jgi:alkanesulfonate monooxygenase SsuD/methylene tetrahydromethanopterin reductase-like flavin-dependent oxidoreductase (luciferase family)